MKDEIKHRYYPPNFHLVQEMFLENLYNSENYDWHLSELNFEKRTNRSLWRPGRTPTPPPIQNRFRYDVMSPRIVKKTSTN